MNNANDTQVGGAHYRAVVQHWDWVLRWRMDYLSGNASKYVVRWRKKNGLADLKKAQHYVAKLLESYESIPRNHAPTPMDMSCAVNEFAKTNNLWWTEERIVALLTTWRDKFDLQVVANHLDMLFSWAVANPEKWEATPGDPRAAE